MSEVVQGFDPRTGLPLGEPLPATTPEEVDRVCRALDGLAHAWATTSRESRARTLEAVADRLDDHTDELAALADGETALGLPRLAGEVARTTGQLRLFAEVLRDGGYLGSVVEPADPGAAPPRPDLRRSKRPTGLVAVFAASNFPFAFSVAGGDTASALAAGCPVVVKAHEAHPRTSARTAELVAEALADCGAPAVFALVHGFDAGVALVRHAAVTGVGFTGSTRGGLALAAECARRPEPVPFFGELGSVNPVVVLPGAARARAEAVATGWAGSLTLGVGQFCTNPGLLFVPDDADLLAALGEAVSATSGAPMLTARIHAAHRDAVVALAARPEVTLLAESTAGEGPWAGRPAAFRVDADDFEAASDYFFEERFGPVGIVVTGATPERAAGWIARGPGQLTCGVHLDETDPDDLAAASRLLDTAARRAGRVVVNGWPTGVAVNRAQQHGGPFPATTGPAHTSVGAAAIDRWLVPVAYQDCPPALLPPELR
ncbi:aldehyde dehydrogenase (NADP(+)) [Streptacidiphilus pinicola]|uniref:Aldehyde dehydrogenase (NADP(+)) n=1 Tax=Streptacidiphilus pinicola TaxID=2219663 RepID=A0A2X0IPA7_9ACTN|nr:aldehyde dehydrogenase (NADP(+)) [Streptacidiphilus pinicola]RAG87062.1 aldehyde dehydrogenase (NADP(+)) [Streptacidiphilus pinicola]